MSVTVRVKLHPQTAKKSLTPAIKREMARQGNKVAQIAKRLCPANTGKLRSSINSKIVNGPGGLPAARVGTSVDYAIFVHNGTRTPITPKNGPFLVFRVGGRGPVVFARQVRGQRARPFLRDALRAARSH